MDEADDAAPDGPETDDADAAKDALFPGRETLGSLFSIHLDAGSVGSLSAMMMFVVLFVVWRIEVVFCK